MIKLLGAALIVAACGGMGIMFKQTLVRRRQDIMSWLYALQAMESEISYGISPMPQVLQSAGKQCQGAVKEFFTVVQAGLDEAKGCTLGHLWQQALEATKGSMALNNDDLAIINNFGQGLGSSSLSDQLKRFALTREQLKKNLTESEEHLSRMGKFWVSMGWCTGIVLMLIMF